jgi:hypothetical protein
VLVLQHLLDSAAPRRLAARFWAVSAQTTVKRFVLAHTFSRLFLDKLKRRKWRAAGSVVHP